MTDSLQPLIDVPMNVVGFARGKVRPFHGLQDLVAAFYASLDTGDEPPVSIADATDVVGWTEKVARAADDDQTRKLQALPHSAKVPYLVTGATGGLGSAVVQRLRAEKERVRIMVRRIPAQVPEGVEVVVGDLGDPDAVDRAVKGAATVIHVGAAMKGGWDAHLGGTVVGTQNVIDACKRHGVKKLVHISSMSVIDWAGTEDIGELSEDSPLEPHAERRGAYTRAKLEAENLVRAACRDDGLPTVILRPGQIFGGRIPLMTGAVARRAGKAFVTLGDGEQPLPLVYLDDVVDAIMLATRGDWKAAEIFQIVDPESLTQNDVLQLVHGPDTRAVHVPEKLLLAGGWLSDVMLVKLGKSSPLSPYRLKSAMARRRFSSQRAHEQLGWTPKVGVREGIQRVVQESEAWD